MLNLLLIRQSITPPTSSTLGRIWVAAQLPSASLSGVIRPGLAERSWSTVRPASTYGVSIRSDEARFRYRIPPDWNEADYPKGAYGVESYLDGFPVWAQRAHGGDALARPLGFEYGSDGYCTNAQVSIWTGDRWMVPHLTNRGKTILLQHLALFDNRYDDRKAPPPAPKPSLLWFKVEAEGYGTYRFYRDLLVVGPEGNRCRLLPEQKENLKDALDGYWNKPPQPDSPRSLRR